MESEKVLLRKYEDDLNVSGMGVIILGAWSIVKLIMQNIYLAKKTSYFDRKSLVSMLKTQR